MDGEIQVLFIFLRIVAANRRLEIAKIRNLLSIRPNIDCFISHWDFLQIIRDKSKNSFNWFFILSSPLHWSFKFSIKKNI